MYYFCSVLFSRFALVENGHKQRNKLLKERIAEGTFLCALSVIAERALSVANTYSQSGHHCKYYPTKWKDSKTQG